jgi:hypothetical protein
MAFILLERAINCSLICSNSSSILELEEFNGTESFSGSISFSASPLAFSTSGFDASVFVGAYLSASALPISEIDLSKIAKKRFSNMKLPIIMRKMKKGAG